MCITALFKALIKMYIVPLNPCALDLCYFCVSMRVCLCCVPLPVNVGSQQGEGGTYEAVGTQSSNPESGVVRRVSALCYIISESVCMCVSVFVQEQLHTFLNL